MNIEQYMDLTIPKLRTMAKERNFEVKYVDTQWEVTYTYPVPDDFFGKQRKFTLPHFLNSSDEKMAILYTLRRYF